MIRNGRAKNLVPGTILRNSRAWRHRKSCIDCISAGAFASWSSPRLILTCKVCTLQLCVEREGEGEKT